MKTADMVGLRFGRWTVKEKAQGKQLLVAECDCGVIRTDLFAPNLRGGLSKSCGCFGKEQASIRKTTHGLSQSKEFWIWSSMRERCSNPRNKAFPNYGGRGVKVCSEWCSFTAFYKDMGPKPSVKHTLERLDNWGDYSKENCRWALPAEQSRNTRRTIRVQVDGEIKCLKDACAEAGVNYGTFRSRCISKGVSYQEGVLLGLLCVVDGRTKEARSQLIDED